MKAIIKNALYDILEFIIAKTKVIKIESFVEMQIYEFVVHFHINLLIKNSNLKFKKDYSHLTWNFIETL